MNLEKLIFSVLGRTHHPDFQSLVRSLSHPAPLLLNACICQLTSAFKCQSGMFKAHAISLLLSEDAETLKSWGNLLKAIRQGSVCCSHWKPSLSSGVGLCLGSGTVMS